MSFPPTPFHLFKTKKPRNRKRSDAFAVGAAVQFINVSVKGARRPWCENKLKNCSRRGLVDRKTKQKHTNHFQSRTCENPYRRQDYRGSPAQTPSCEGRLISCSENKGMRKQRWGEGQKSLTSIHQNPQWQLILGFVPSTWLSPLYELKNHHINQLQLITFVGMLGIEVDFIIWSRKTILHHFRWCSLSREGNYSKNERSL